MTFTMVFSLLGGLGLFIYGMRQMSEGLQKAAGKKMRRLLAVLTTRPLMGILAGTGVTAIIQSSSATTVMVVGFVNAGLMTLAQSIGVIMGANIGTTITAQLIAFKLSHYSLHAIAIGAALYLFGKSEKVKEFGQIILGFGILFLGLTIMKDTMKPLRDAPIFVDALSRFSSSPILGLLLGAGITIVVQSSSASIGILISLLAVGIFNYQLAIPILLGTNIGTTITAILSSVGANKAAKRAAAAHSVFNVLGASFVILIIYLVPGFTGLLQGWLTEVSVWLGETPSPERMIANTHTIFNVINTVIWLPFIPLMVKIVDLIIPGEEVAIKRGLSFLDERMLETPTLALDQLQKEVIRMYDITQEMLNDAIRAFRELDREAVKTVKNKEEIINELEEELVIFLTKFHRNSLADSDINTVDMYYAMIDDIESIADDANDIAELANYRRDNKVEFSGEAEETMEENINLISSLLEDTHRIIKDKEIGLTEKILEGEKKMDALLLKYREGHMKRLGEGICTPNAGIVYLEMLDSLEHITDQMADITHSFLEAM